MAGSDQRQNNKYLITMNANGPDGRDQRDRRKELLARLLRDEKPLLVFMQEFVWADIDSWDDDVKSCYKYIGYVEERERKGVGFVFNKEMVKLNHRDEQIRANCEISFQYRHRMYMCVMNIGDFECLCISWHGPHNGLDKDDKNRIFLDFLSMVSKMKTKFKCPVIVGGDFNLKAEIVEGHDIKTLQVHGTKKSIDMFLVDKDLKINEEPQPIDWFTNARQRKDPKTGLIIFDHDAVPLRLQIRKKRG